MNFDFKAIAAGAAVGALVSAAQGKSLQAGAMNGAIIGFATPIVSSFFANLLPGNGKPA